MAILLAGILHPATIVRLAVSAKGQAEYGEAHTGERDGQDQHERRRHDADEDGDRSHDSGEGFPVALHEPDVRTMRCHLAWH